MAITKIRCTECEDWIKIEIERLIGRALSSKENALAAFKRSVQTHRNDGLKSIRNAIQAL